MSSYIYKFMTEVMVLKTDLLRMSLNQVRVEFVANTFNQDDMNRKKVFCT